MTAARFGFGLFLLAAITGVTGAHVGQSVAGLVERHGRVRSERRIEIGPRSAPTYFRELYFLDGEWTIIALFDAHHCIRITYRKPGNWTQGDLDRWLRLNTFRDNPWEERPSGDPGRQREWLSRLLLGAVNTAVWRPTEGLTVTASDYEKIVDRARHPPRRRPPSRVW